MKKGHIILIATAVFILLTPVICDLLHRAFFKQTPESIPTYHRISVGGVKADKEAIQLRVTSEEVSLKVDSTTVYEKKSR